MAVGVLGGLARAARPPRSLMAPHAPCPLAYVGDTLSTHAQSFHLPPFQMPPTLCLFSSSSPPSYRVLYRAVPITSGVGQGCYAAQRMWVTGSEVPGLGYGGFVRFLGLKCGPDVGLVMLSLSSGAILSSGVPEAYIGDAPLGIRGGLPALRTRNHGQGRCTIVWSVSGR